MISLLKNHQTEPSELRYQYGVVRLEIFGSAVTGAFNPESDLDSLVRFSKKPGLSLVEQYFGFNESLEELFGRSVDLVEEEAVTNLYFLRAIQLERTLLYAA
jgi:predicted nucleotidyltransferase